MSLHLAISKWSRSLALILILLFGPALGSAEVYSQNVSVQGEFSVPKGMEGRVNFWIDIFGRYGKHQIVLHHREYPQAQFGVLDFSTEAATMSPIQLSKFMERTRKAEIARIEETMRFLATGREPQTAFESKIAAAMQSVPGGVQKYSKVIKDDLVRSQTGIKDKMKAAIERSGRYLPMMERIFSEFGLPIELTRLPFVESSFDYTAYSSVGAAGIWQFMPRTAKLFSMSVNQAIDERRDPIRATISAAKYLKMAYDELGTWPLALTSYNHGVYGVKKAIKNMGTTDIATIVEYDGKRAFGFASNNFYSEFLASLIIYKNYKRFFPEIQIEPALRYEQIELTSATNIGAIRAKLGIDLDELKRLNYAISKRAWEGRVNLPRGYMLKVPVGYGTHAERIMTPERTATVTASSIYGGTKYTVRPGDTLSSIAKRFHLTVQQIKDENGLAGNSLRVGQVLAIRKDSDPAKREQVVRATPSVKPAPKPAASTRTHVVAKGDSLWSIAKQYGLSINDLKTANSIPGSGIKAGQKLLIPE